MRRLAACRRAMALALALTLPLSAQAQVQASDTVTVKPVPAVAKVGKWVLLGATLGMGLLAASSHDKAESAYDDLEQYCASDQSRCDLNSGGTYIDPTAEGYYQESIRYDQHARRWFIGGEVALLGAAALFIWEFTRPHEKPDNIPFEPEFQVGPANTRLGVRVSF